jgi:hypothetical protein
VMKRTLRCRMSRRRAGRELDGVTGAIGAREPLARYGAIDGALRSRLVGTGV